MASTKIGALVAGVLSATFTPELARAATEQPRRLAGAVSARGAGEQGQSGEHGPKTAGEKQSEIGGGS